MPAGQPTLPYPAPYIPPSGMTALQPGPSDQVRCQSLLTCHEQLRSQELPAEVLLQAQDWVSSCRRAVLIACDYPHSSTARLRGSVRDMQCLAHILLDGFGCAACRTLGKSVQDLALRL